MATTATTTPKDILLSEDVSAQAELLLNLLNDAAAGRELSTVLSDVIQVTIAGGLGNVHIKKLAYDLCKAVPLSNSDYELISDGIKNDISSGHAETTVLALQFLPYLPGQLLVAMLERGDINTIIVPQTRSPSPHVRAAAATSLGALLLMPDVQASLAVSQGLVSNASEWWDAVVDGVMDQMPVVIVSSIAAAVKLFEAAEAAAPASSQGQLCRANAVRAAHRMSAVLGPLLDTWRMLSSNSQVAVTQLLGHLARYLMSFDMFQTILDASDALDADAGTLSASLPAIVSYLSAALNSLNPAVKLGAGRVLLHVARESSSQAGGINSGSESKGGRRGVGIVPPAVAAAAIEALLELKDLQLVEAGLQEIVSLVASHLDVLQVGARMAVLQRLWPLIAVLQSPTDRMTAFANVWRAALELHLETKAAQTKGADLPGGATMSTILADPFIHDAIQQQQKPSAILNTPGAAAPAVPIPGLPSQQLPNEPTTLDGEPHTPSSTTSGISAGPTGGIAAGPTGGSISLQSSSSSRRLLKSASQSISRSAKNMTKAISSATTASLDSANELLKSAVAALPKFGADGAGRPPLPATLKQELLCTLLEVISRHPSADIALKLPAGERVEPPAPPQQSTPGAAAAGAPGAAVSTAGAAEGAGSAAGTGAAAGATAEGSAADGVSAASTSGAAGGLDVVWPPPAMRPSAATAGGAAPTAAPPASSLAIPALGTGDDATAALSELQARSVLWISAATAALMSTKACLMWEPLVPPPMAGQPPTPPLPPMETVNLTTVPVDLWLQLLQATCHAVRAVMRVHGHSSLVGVYRANAGRMLPRLAASDAGGGLAKCLEECAVALQQILQKALLEWRVLSLAVRPRALWVAAHYLELPAMLEETWSHLLSCTEEALIRAFKVEADGHARQLAVSATDGVLFKPFAPLQLGQGSRDRAGARMTFDVAAASALVELPEYRSDGLQVGLTVLQYLVWLVQSNVAKAPGGIAGPAEAALARRLLDVVKAVGVVDATGVDLREWCRRMVRTLNGILEPAGAGQAGITQGGAGPSGPGGYAFTLQSVGGAASQRTTAGGNRGLPGGYNPVAGFTALGFGGRGSDDGSSSSGGESDDDSDSSSVTGGATANGKAAGAGADGGSDDDEAAEKLKKAEKERAAEAARAAAQVGLVNEPQSMTGAWGYPFGGPRSNTLFISRRARRHRLLHRQINAAFANLAAADAAEGRGEGAGVSGSSAGDATAGDDDTGPVFSASSGFRLDQPAFWEALRQKDGSSSGASGSSAWQELSGSSDPLVLSGCYGSAPGGGNEVLVTLKAFNRLDTDVEDVEVQIRLVGPVKAERREAVWNLPKLLPTEAATHSFKLIPCGYGRMEVHCRMQLPVAQLRSEAALPTLHCRPLVISMAHTLRKPPSAGVSAEDFLRLWSGLPVRAELSATCVWPGVDGMLLMLSALQRQPMHTAWLRALPALCGAQAAYLSSVGTGHGDSLAIVLVAQLMPGLRGAGEAAAAAPVAAAVPAAAAGEGADDGKQAQQARQQWQQQQRAAVQVLVRSSSQEVLHTVRSHAAAWLHDLSQGTLTLGLVPRTALSPNKPLLHPAVAKLEHSFRAAAPVMPVPPVVPEPVTPQEPEILRRLKPKKDEEDSDAEDIELPPTPEEVAAEQQARDQHEEACARVAAAHKRKLQERAAAMLRLAALSEWHRLAMPAVS